MHSSKQYGNHHANPKGNTGAITMMQWENSREHIKHRKSNQPAKIMKPLDFIHVITEFSVSSVCIFEGYASFSEIVAKQIQGRDIF